MKWQKIRPGVYQYGEWTVYGVPQTSGHMRWFVEPGRHPHFMLRTDAKRYVENQIQARGRG